MKTLQSVEFEHLNVKYLGTVDPISRITCTPMQGLFEYLNQEFPVNQHDFDHFLS